MRTTDAQVEAAFRRYAAACASLGLLPAGARLELTQGSKANGIAYRVNMVVSGATRGHRRPPAGDDYLGRTAAEAFERLCDRSAVLEDVLAARLSVRAEVQRIVDACTDVDDDGAVNGADLVGGNDSTDGLLAWLVG